MNFFINESLPAILPRPTRKSFDIIEEKMKNIFFHDKKIGFIGLCGGQASGKTKIANYFHKNITTSAIISEKDFFKANIINRNVSTDKEPLIGAYDDYSKERKALLIELSNPNSYDYDKLNECVEKLENGEKVTINQFNEKTGLIEQDNVKEIDPNIKNLIIIEGYFIFHNKKLREKFDLKLYTEVDDDVRLSRLILRENVYIKNNSNGFKTFFSIYEKYLKTSFESNIETCKKYANIIFPNYEIAENDEIQVGDDTLEFLLVNLKNISLQINK